MPWELRSSAHLASVYNEPGCPKEEKEVKAEAALLKEAQDLLAGMMTDVKEAGKQLEKATPEKAADAVAKVLSYTKRLFEVEKEGSDAKDLYYLTFGPYTHPSLSAAVTEVRAALKALWQVANRLHTKERAAWEEARAPKKDIPAKFLEVNEYLLHKRSRSRLESLAASGSRAKMFDWFYDLWNTMVAPSQGGYYIWGGRLQPGHCGNDPALLWSECHGAFRDFATHPSKPSCVAGLPIANPAAPPPKPQPTCSWWSPGKDFTVKPPAIVCTPDFRAKSKPKATAVLGVFQHIAARLCPLSPQSCVNDGYNLMTYWADECPNLQWVYCIANGLVENQPDNRITIVEPPSAWRMADVWWKKGRALMRTHLEYCTLHFICQDSSELFNQAQDFTFQCQLNPDIHI